ncbi:MAG: cupredoxin domain-containing protein [bacterium]|nr:cupredoxin domain-containing protein [bacterium]
MPISNGVNKKIVISLLIVAGLAALIYVFVFNGKKQPVAETASQNQAAVKEFTMTSFYEMVDGQPKPQYSLNEITVNQGDRVRIKITVTKGNHDFKIDELNVFADTQLNQEAVVEFTADKTGEFIYYCTKPGHRQNGHWGTLKVLAK